MSSAQENSEKKRRIGAWRPATFGEFIGEANRRAVARLQRIAVAHRPVSGNPSPLGIAPPTLLIGPYGCSKTVLAEHFVKACCCPHADPRGNPCNTCIECLSQGPERNGEGLLYRHYFFDCARIQTRHDLCEKLLLAEEIDEVAVIWDEFGKLADRRSMDMLLGTATRFRGVFVATTTDEDFCRLPPPLFERLRKVWLETPTEEEITAFLKAKADEWGIHAPRNMVQRMVRGTRRSFRSCLDIMQAASENSPPVLDIPTIREFTDV